MSDERERGRIIHWNFKAGVGAIKPHQGGTILHCTWQELPADVPYDQRLVGRTVTFTVEPDPLGRRPNAREVRLGVVRNLERVTGTVKSWNDVRGYGFLLPDDDLCPDIFIDRANLASAHVEAHEMAGRRLTVSVVHDGRGRPQGRFIELAP